MTPLERDLVDGDRWEFDGPVAARFDEMLDRSIPDLDRLRSLVHEIGSSFASGGSTVLDLGSSRGDSLVPFLNDGVGRRYVAVEKSPPMLEALRERFSGRVDVEIVPADLRDGLRDLRRENGSYALAAEGVDLALAVLTLQFVPVDHRLALLDDVTAALRPGGALIVVEKTLPASRSTSALFRETYWRFKRAMGYSEDEIVRKSLALEGELVPFPARWNEEALEARFSAVEGFWRWLQFAGWVAVK